MNKNESFANVRINCEEWANAKLPKSVQKWTLYKYNIFRDLIKRGENMEKIRYSEISVEQLDEYGNIPFYYDTTQKYELER